MGHDQDQDGDQDRERRAELLAAALAGELTPRQEEELTALQRRDPSVQAELAGLRELSTLLGSSGLRWREDLVPDGVPDLLLPAGAQQEPVGHRRRRAPVRRALVGAAAAGVLLLTGAVGGDLVRQLRDAPPSGPPGTLGAVEPITFTGAPPDSSIEASLVAHTWGTETVLEVEGAPVGETLEVVLVTQEGEQLSSGTFLGTEATVTCRMNAAVLRPEVVRVLIERADGSVLASSALPGASR